MGSMALCPTVSQLAFAAVLQPPLCFPAIFLVIGSSPSLFFLVLGYFLVWPYCPYVVLYCRGGTGRIVVTCYAMVSISTLCRQLNFKATQQGFPSIGTPRHWNPEWKHRDIGTSGHWNPKCTGRRKGTNPRTGNGHRPEERFSFFQVPPWQSLAVSLLRVSLPSRSWRLRRPGWVHVGCRYGFWSPFPETVRGFPGFRRRHSILELMLFSEG